MTLLFLEQLALNTERKLVELLNGSITLAGKAFSSNKISAATYNDFLNQVDNLCDFCHNEWDDLPRILEGNYREYYME